MSLPDEYASYEGLLENLRSLNPPPLENALLGTNTQNRTKSKAFEASRKPSLERLTGNLSQFTFLQLNIFYQVVRKLCKHILKRKVSKSLTMDTSNADCQNIEYAVNEGDMLRYMSRREKKRSSERHKHKHRRLKEYEEDNPPPYLEEDKILAEKQIKPEARERSPGPAATRSDDVVLNYKMRRELQLKHLSDALTRVGTITRTLEESFKNSPPKRKSKSLAHSVETQTRLLEAICPILIKRKVASCSALVRETKKPPIVKPKTSHDMRRPPPKEDTISNPGSYFTTIQSSDNFLDKYASHETFMDTPGEAPAVAYAEEDEATKACLEFRETANQVLSRFSKEVNDVLQDCCCSVDDIWDCIRHTLDEIKDVGMNYGVMKDDLKCISSSSWMRDLVEENQERHVIPLRPVQSQSENQEKLVVEAEDQSQEEIENEIEHLPLKEKVRVSNAELNLSLERYLDERLSSYEVSKVETSNAETNIDMSYYPSLVQERVYVCNIPPTISVVEENDIVVTPQSDEKAEPITISPELQQQLREIATNLDVEVDNLTRTKAQQDIHCRLVRELAATDSLLEFQRKMEFCKPRKRQKKREPKPAEIIEDLKPLKPPGIAMEELYVPSRKINKIGPCKPRPPTDCYKFALYKETKKKKVHFARQKKEKQPIIQLPTKSPKGGRVEEKNSKYEGSLWFSKKKGEASSSRIILGGDSTPKFSETRITSETNLQAQAHLDCSVKGQVMNIQSTHQKAGLNCFDILDEISHKDIKPLESEYPRKDHIGTEPLHPRVESTYLYKLVYNTTQDDFLKLLRIEEPILQCSTLNCHLCREMRCSIDKEPKEDPEDAPTEKEDKKRAIRKTSESRRFRKVSPVTYNAPVENLRTKVRPEKPEKKKLLEGNKFAPHKWKKKKNNDVLAKLAPYMFDPKMRYPTTITVMPVTVTYFAPPKSPPCRGDCPDVKWKRKTSSQDVAAMLSPYMYDPKMRYPTTITAMPTTITYASPNFSQQRGPLRPLSDEYSKSRKGEYRVADFSRKGMPEKKLWETKYPKTPTHKLVSYVGRHEEHLQQNERWEKWEHPRSPLTTVTPPIKTLKGVPLSKSFDVTYQLPRSNSVQPSKSKMKKVVSTLNDHDGNKIVIRGSSPLPVKTSSKTNARTPRIESTRPKLAKKTRTVPTLENNIENIIEMMEGKIVEMIHSPDKQRSGAFEQVEQEIKQILRNLKQDESPPLDVIQEGNVKPESKSKKVKKGRSPSPEDVKTVLQKVEIGSFQTSSLLLSDVSHGSARTSKSSHHDERFVVTTSYNPGHSKTTSPTRDNSLSESKKGGDSSQVSLVIDAQKESVKDSGDAKPISAEQEIQSTEPDLKLDASDLLIVNAANESIQKEIEEIINNMLDDATLPVLAPPQEPPNTETAVVPLKPKHPSETTIQSDDANKSTIVLKLKATLPRQKNRRRPNSAESKTGAAFKTTTDKSCCSTQTYYTKIRITHYKQTNHMPQLLHQPQMFYSATLLQLAKITGTPPAPLRLDCRGVQLAKHLISSINFKKLGFLSHNAAADIRTLHPKRPAILWYRPGRMVPYMPDHEIIIEDCSSRENVSRCPRTCISDPKEHGTFLNSLYGMLFTTMFTGLTFNYSCH